MPQSLDDRTAELAGQIEAYLLAHPEAADTIEGVAKWWLDREKHQNARKFVESALELLEEQGAVVKSPLINGRFIYSRVKK